MSLDSYLDMKMDGSQPSTVKLDQLPYGIVLGEDDFVRMFNDRGLASDRHQSFSSASL